jgi:hypothetical protein
LAATSSHFTGHENARRRCNTGTTKARHRRTGGSPREVALRRLLFLPEQAARCARLRVGKFWPIEIAPSLSLRVGENLPRVDKTQHKGVRRAGRSSLLTDQMIIY